MVLKTPALKANVLKAVVLKAVATSLLLCACQPTPTPREKFHYDVTPAKPNAPNTFEVVAARQAPFTLEVHVTSDTEDWFFERKEPATSHRIPLLGLGVETDWTVSATLFTAEGKTVETQPREIQTPALPLNFPILTELMGTPRPLGNGYLLFDLKTGSDEYNYIVILDADLQVIWWREDPIGCSDLHQTARGTIQGLCNNLATDMLLTGETLSRKPVEAEDRDDLNLHHELHPLPEGGYLSLHSERIQVEDYPISNDEPEVLAPSEIRSDELVWIDNDLQLIDSWHLSDLLPTSRIGFDSISRNPDAKVHDWSHTNGIVRDPQDGGMIVSVRHLDTLLKLDENGALKWILANPDGWPAEWEDYRLEGLGDFRYPHHQHAPEIDELGRLWVFDNGNDGGRTPYSENQARLQELSRVVAYEIDEEAFTFKQLHSFGLTAFGPAYSSALGDADWLPHLQSVMSVWGRLHEPVDDGHPLPGSNGFSAHILLHKPGQETPVMHLEMTGCYCDEEVYKTEHKGWNTYRAEWIPTLYPPGQGPKITTVAQESPD
jgi:hypothetical protein